MWCREDVGTCFTRTAVNEKLNEVCSSGRSFNLGFPLCIYYLILSTVRISGEGCQLSLNKDCTRPSFQSAGLVLTLWRIKLSDQATWVSCFITTFKMFQVMTELFFTFKHATVEESGKIYKSILLHLRFGYFVLTNFPSHTHTGIKEPAALSLRTSVLILGFIL